MKGRKDGNPSLVANFRGTLKQDPAIAGLSVPTHPRPAPTGIPWHCHPGRMYSAGGWSDVSLRGSLLQHSRLPDVEPWSTEGGSTGPGLGYHAPQPTPNSTTQGGLRGHPSPSSLGTRREASLSQRFRIHKGDVLGLRSVVGLFGLNGQRMEKSVFLTFTMHYLK